jgi:hypothetical protein
VPLAKSHYAAALAVQDACNLSGVVHAWSRSLSAIWERARECGEGTGWVNAHPINVLFASKVSSLTGSEGDGRYSEAHRTCSEASEK